MIMSFTLASSSTVKACPVWLAYCPYCKQPIWCANTGEAQDHARACYYRLTKKKIIGPIQIDVRLFSLLG
jgi:hypothetical protein